jgi:hypothetical protein
MIEAPPTVSVQPLGTQISLGAQMQLASFALGQDAQSVFVMQGASSQVPALQRPGDPLKSQAVPSAAAGLSHRPSNGSHASSVQSLPSSQSTPVHKPWQAPALHRPGRPPKSQVVSAQSIRPSASLSAPSPQSPRLGTLDAEA